MTVLLVHVPVELLGRDLDHLDDLMHELRIVRAGHDSGDAPVDEGLAGELDGILDTDVWAYRALGHQVVVAAGANAAADVELAYDAARACQRCLTGLAPAESLCRQLALLTLAVPGEVARLRTWVCDEVDAQVGAGRPPTPFM